jgi:hypothetical protein
METRKMDEEPETPSADRNESEGRPEIDWEALGRSIAMRYREVLAKLAD